MKPCFLYRNFSLPFIPFIFPGIYLSKLGRSFEKFHYVYTCMLINSVVGSQFIALNSVAPTCAMLFRFR